MRRIIKSTTGLIKGAPTAVIVSAAIHAAILLFAGGLVVFHIVNKEPVKFVPPPPVERPPMDLKKPRVKMKNKSKPRSVQRIVSKRVAGVPDIHLPAISGAGSGLSGGPGGYELLPDISNVTLFGGTESISVGNDFEGTFFSLSYDRMGNETSANLDQTLKQLNENNWNPLALSHLYRAPNKLYATQFMVPPAMSIMGPRAFGQNDPDFNTHDWLVLYKGKIASRTSGRFRFWGYADLYLFIRINGKIVFAFTWPSYKNLMIPWTSSSDENQKYYMGYTGAEVGEWFEMKAEEPVVMEVLMGDEGGFCGFLLAIEDESEDYERNENGLPFLPAFKTAEFSETVKAKIQYKLIRNEINLDSDLMFNIY